MSRKAFEMAVVGLTLSLVPTAVVIGLASAGISNIAIGVSYYATYRDTNGRRWTQSYSRRVGTGGATLDISPPWSEERDPVTGEWADGP